MGDFKKFGKKFGNGGDRRPFGNDRFGSGNKFGHRTEGGRQMFSATCSECGDACEVPFRPVGGKPVLCSRCFKGKESSAPRFGAKSFGDDRRGGFSGPRDRDRGGFVPKAPQVTKEMFDSLSAKVDKILAILSLPKKPQTSGLDLGEPAELKQEKKKAVSKEKAPAKKVAEEKVLKEKKTKKK